MVEVWTATNIVIQKLLKEMIEISEPRMFTIVLKEIHPFIKGNNNVERISYNENGFWIIFGSR